LKVIKRTTPYKLVRLLLLIMFIGHYGSISMFYHTHSVDGVVFCHSHFYWFDDSSTPIQLPQHTQDELKLIHDYNQYTWSAETRIPQIGIPIVKLIDVFLCPQLVANLGADVLYTSLRAPPSILV